MSPEFDALFHEDFEFYKGTGFLISAVLVVSLQMLLPNRLGIRDLLSNWKVNVPLALINLVLLSILCGACASAVAVSVREARQGAFEFLGLSYYIQVVFTVFVLDLVAYLWHRANHAWSLLWRFHAVHHSDNHFDASTAVRFHLVELLISLGIRLAVVFILGLPVLGLIVFEVIYGFFNLLVHSDLRLPGVVSRVLSLVLVTPALHLIHHSVNREEHNRNFGTIFSFWDRLLLSYLAPTSSSTVRVGLLETGVDLSLNGLLVLPFSRRGGRRQNQ